MGPAPSRSRSPALAADHLPRARARAQALLEFAFVLVFGLLAIVMVIDIGRFYYEYTAMRGGLLMGAASMQAFDQFSGLAACNSTDTWYPSSPSSDDKCDRIRRIIVNASGLTQTGTTDLQGNPLGASETEAITMTAVPASATLFTACTKYQITWRRPFLPIAPYARQLLALTGSALVLTATINGQHNNSPAGTACP
jgi:hypothetical protein